MKLDEDPFPMNMNIVQLEGKKVIIQPSQAESTKGKDVVVGEERQPRMIKPKSPKHDKWKKMRGTSHNLAQRLLSTSSWLSTGKVGPVSRSAKSDHPVSLDQASTDPRHHRGKIQKVGIIIKGSVI
jgi:hypothetical protein